MALTRRVEVAAARFVDVLVLEGVDRMRAGQLVSAFAEKIAGKKAIGRPPNQDVSRALAFYADMYQQRLGEWPLFDHDEGAGILGRLVRMYGLTRVQTQLYAYLQSDEPGRAAAGYSLRLFAASWNALTIAARHRQATGQCPHEPVCRSFAACRARRVRESGGKTDE